MSIPIKIVNASLYGTFEGEEFISFDEYTAEAYEVITKVREAIKEGKTNSSVGSVVYVSFYDLFDKYPNDAIVIDRMMELIDVGEFYITVLFAFLSAANLKRRDLKNYNSLLNKMKVKLKTEKNLTDTEVKKNFYGLE